MEGERGRARAAPSASIFGCEHDGEDTNGLARVFAALRHGAVVIVDLPENAFAVVLECAKIPLAVRIIIRGERVECLHLLADCGLLGQRKSIATDWWKKACLQR